MRKKEVVKTPFEVAVDEFFNAAAGVRQAQSNFDNAEPEFFEIANEELTLAKERLRVAGMKVKMLG